MIPVHQKYEQSAVVMSVYGITLRGIFVFLLRGRHEQNVSGRRASRARWLSEEAARRPDSYHLREARLEKLENFTVYAVDGTSHADSRLFAGHKMESKYGDLRNSAFSVKGHESVPRIPEGGELFKIEKRTAA